MHLMLMYLRSVQSRKSGCYIGRVFDAGGSQTNCCKQGRCYGTAQAFLTHEQAIIMKQANRGDSECCMPCLYTQQDDTMPAKADKGHKKTWAGDQSLAFL